MNDSHGTTHESPHGGEKADFKSALKSLSALLIVLGGLWFFQNVLGEQFQSNALFGLGFLVLGGIAIGRLCVMVGIPSLTGHLAAGIVSGPSFLTIITETQVDQLRLVNGLALALIAMHAGCEFTKDMLVKNFKSLFHCTWSHIVFIGAGTILAVVLLQPYVDFLQGFNLLELVAIGALFSTVAISKSPAVVVAVLARTSS